MALLGILGSVNAFPSSLEKRQCEATLATAVSVAERLQSHYFNIITGEYTGGSHWTDANAIEDIHNLMLATGTGEFSSLADNSYIGRTANLQADLGISLWSTILGGSYDDASWIILSLWKIADYKAARGLDASAYIASANTIHSIVEAQWDTTVCGGGVWWSSAKNYKNSITNELFLFVSATGAINFPSNTAFLANANKTWNWIKNSGLRNAQGLYNDGLTSSCANNGEETWIYNQGVIASGLAALYVVTGDVSLLDEAEITLDATISLLTTNGILRESCDDAASGGTTCDSDQQIFKGIFTKLLQYYLDRANDPARTAKYSGFLGAQSSAVYHYGTDASTDVGSVWYAPNQGGSGFYTPARISARLAESL
ncbi:glycoside hydrolase [Mycena sp. CBHHK59/15]|nr:glycoside hydrolase [Mycena sp. CBHHK59/15]